MNKKDCTRFVKLIEAERERLANKLDAIGEGISDRTASQSASNQSYSNHMADVGSDAMEQEQAFLHASQGADYLRLLDDALKRLDDGTYGVCEICSGKIPLKRLEAYLAARLCLTCKTEQEKVRRS